MGDNRPSWVAGKARASNIYSQLVNDVNEQQYQENGLEASSATTQGTEQEDAGCCAGYQLKGLAHSVI